MWVMNAALTSSVSIATTAAVGSTGIADTSTPPASSRVSGRFFFQRAARHSPTHAESGRFAFAEPGHVSSAAHVYRASHITSSPQLSVNYSVDATSRLPCTQGYALGTPASKSQYCQ